MISIVVPCRNEAAHIEGCVRSILAQEDPGQPLEVLIADGMSDDGTRAILERLSDEDARIRMVNNPERVTPTGLNHGIAAAEGDIIIRMDAHTEYAPDYVKACVEVLAETGAQNVGGAARTKTKGYLHEAIAAAYHSPYSTGGAAFHKPDYEGEVDTVTYGCWHKDWFDQVGLFDEELVRNQDDEFNLRTVRAGGKIWQSPRIKSWYSPRNTLRALFKQYSQYGYYKVRVIQKHKLPASWRHLVPGALVVTFGALGAGALVSNLARGALALAAGTYGAGLLAASVDIARKTEWKYLPVLPAVLAAFHFGYGTGFVRGVVDFVALKRGPRGSFTVLTRGQA